MSRSTRPPWRLALAALAFIASLGAIAGCQAPSGVSRGPTATTATATAHATATATAHATVTATATATATRAPTATPAPSGPYSFPLIPPGAALPSEAWCAAHIQRSGFEPRPNNQTANTSVPTAAQIAALAPWDESIGLDPRANQLRAHMTGQFTGTTDEILQWVACVWGVPVDVVRAEAVVESYWNQSQLGDTTNTQSDCPPGTWNGASCYQSYGILQIQYQWFTSTWPMSRDDTAFNAEFVYGQIRTCYEGWTDYLNDRTPLPGYPPYHAGDLWGCVGRWYSGGWYDQGAVDYIAKVRAALNQKLWLTPGF